MPTHSIDQQNRGQILYRQGKYKDALEVFDSIIKKWPGKNLPMSVLDNRTATLIKLKKYDEALKDARRMIKEDQTVSSGYLRAGQILRAQDKDKQVAEIYKHGLKHVTDPAAITLLNKELAKVQRNITPDGAKDWVMTVLPSEIIQMIIEYLEFKETIRWLRVCRHWNETLMQTPWLWRELDFGREPNIKIKHKTIESYCQRANWKVKKLALPIAAPGTMNMIVKKCKALEELRFGYGGGLAEKRACIPSLMQAYGLRNLNLLNYPMNHDEVAILIDSLPNLESLAVGMNPISSPTEKFNQTRITTRMRNLCIGDGTFASRVATDNRLLDEAFGLQSLTISIASDGVIDLRHLENLRSLKICIGGDVRDVALPECIEKVEVIYWGTSGAPSLLHSDLEEGQPLLRLRSLAIRYVRCTLKMTRWLSICGNEIESLLFPGATDDLLELFTGLVHGKRFTKLRRLALMDTGISDDDMETLGRNCPDLKVLTIDHGSKVTGNGIRRLVEAVHGLEALNLIRCEHVSLDVMEWIKRRGVKTSLFRRY